MAKTTPSSLPVRGRSRSAVERSPAVATDDDPISPRVHGTLDYPLATVLLGGPRVLNFREDTATAFMLAVGGAASVLAVGTAWSRGIIRVIPPVAHGVADLAATTALIAAPFVLGFTRDRRATAFCIAVGAGGLGATLLTRFESDLEPAADPTQTYPAI